MRCVWLWNKEKPHEEKWGLGGGERDTVIRRTGSYLLSRVLRRSTMGDEGFNDRVRNGIGWDTFAITTSSSNHCED